MKLSMKKLCFAVFLLPLMVIGQTFEKGLLSMTEITVKIGHSAQFEDGMKKWKECMVENETTGNWAVWERVQGEGNVYGITGNMEKWAEMDEESSDPASGKCVAIFYNFIVPHVEKVSNAITTTLPEWSKKTMSTDTKLVWVSYFKVKNYDLFSNTVKDVSSTIASKEGTPRGQWYAFQGGSEHDPDYMVVSTFNSYAALDEDEDGPFKVYENVHGKKKADQMKENWRNSVDTGWSYLWELQTELSN